jgi:hypothetical protein
MGVCLVANIPYNFVVWGIKNIMKGNGEVNHSQTGSQMTCIDRHDIDNEFPQLFAQKKQFIFMELFKIGGRVDLT